MSNRVLRLLLPAALLVALSLVLLVPTSAQEDMLAFCRFGGFSVEEDFMRGRADYISDGDLLSFNGQVCARNADLLQRFDINVDLGLDGVDVLDVEKRLVAFSTELDSPFGTFTAGDLLVTNGLVIPNALLMLRFNVNYNVGLDEVKFIGRPEAIVAFVEEARGLEPGALAERLEGMLKQHNLDIWFSIEGTVRLGDNEPRMLLDGDMLSIQGFVVRSQSELFAVAYPAGIPVRGVDFGLDAFAVPRIIENPREIDFPIYFSTELLFPGGRGARPFTDGDVLFGGNVIIPNSALVAPFTPRSPFLGLDALYMRIGQGEPVLTELCDRPIGLFDNTTGLYQEARTRDDGASVTVPRPCGLYVPIHGELPETNVSKFRVVYRDALNIAAPVTGIQTTWTLETTPFGGWSLGCGLGAPITLTTDGSGWMDASDYWLAVRGNLTSFGTQCPKTEMRLAVWNSLTAPDPNGLYSVWLEWEDSGGNLFRELFEHRIQLDNTAPVVGDLKLRIQLEDGSTALVGACSDTRVASSDIFGLMTQIEDDYYDYFYAVVKGGDPPGSHNYGVKHYYNDPVDPEFENTDETGTVPDATLVHVQDLDMNLLGASFTDCCYLLDFYAYDRSIRHSFNTVKVNEVDPNGANAFITFNAAP